MSEKEYYERYWKMEFDEWLKRLENEVNELRNLFYNRLGAELRSIHYSDLERYYGDEIKPLEETTKRLK